MKQLFTNAISSDVAVTKTNKTFSFLLRSALMLQAMLLCQSALQAQNTWYVNDNSTTGDVYTTAVGASGNTGTAASPFATIAEAITAASAGDIINVDAGTYSAQNITINKKLDIRGQGTNTILQNSGGTVITYTAAGSGASSSDRAYLRNVKLSGATKGIYAQELVNHITLDSITIDAVTSYGIHVNNTSGTMNDWVISNSTFNGNSSAYYGSTASNISGVSITGCTFTNHTNTALYVGQSSGTPGGMSNVTISGNTFTSNGPSNNQAAMYIEKLSNATISNNSFTNNGLSTNPRAIIINLKYGTYSGISISGNSFVENRGATQTNGYGINIQGRNDATSYSSFPATLSTVSVSSNRINGFLRGIEIDNAVDWSSTTLSNNALTSCSYGILGVVYGTGNTANAGKTLEVHDNSITGAILTIANSNPNSSTINATCNWHGSASANTIAPKISGTVTYNSWLTSGTDSDTIAIAFQPVPGTCTGTPITLTATFTNVDCHGNGNGAINITVSGGTAPYTYAWSNAATTEDLSGLGAGTYIVVVTDANGSSATDTFDITEPAAALTLSATATQIACNGGTGSVNLIASGGTATYTYGGDATSSLVAGTYNYTVTDANGCTATATATINAAPAALVASSSAGTLACPSGTTTVTVSATGGVEPYSGTGAFTVGAGAYSYTVTDANGCTSTTTGTVATPAHTGTTWYVNDGSTTGDVYATAAGSASGIGTAACPFNSVGAAITAAAAGDTILVDAGTYANKITVSKSLTILGAKAGQDARTRSTASGESIFDGTTLPGTPYDAIKIGNGVSNVIIDGFEIANYSGSGSNGDGNGISSYCMSTNKLGSTNITVRNNYIHNVAYNGILVGSENTNAANTSMVMQSGWLIQYNKISVYKYAGIELTNVSSSQVKDNDIAAVTTLFNDPGDAGVGIEIAARSRAKASAVSTVEVSGNNITGSFPTGSRAAINLLSRAYSSGSNASLTGVTVDKNTITGATNVRAAVLAVAETRNVGPSAINNLAVTNNVLTGNYAGVEVQDYKNGGTNATHSGITVLNNDISSNTSNGVRLTSTTSGAGITVSDNSMVSNGTYAIKHEGTGTLTATCNWYGSTAAATVATKVSGTVTYSPWLVSGTDTDVAIGFQPAAGTCTGTPVTASVTFSTNVTCNGGSNGAIDISITGGTGPYTFVWSNSDTTEDLSGLAAGSYSVTVTDVNGSTATASATIMEPAVISSSSTTTICADALPYSWNGLSFTAAGTQTATLAAANGCDSLASLTLTVNPLTSSLTTITACNTYTWNSETYTTSGSYTFMSTNQYGCDSAAILALTVNYSSSSLTNEASCNNFTWNGVTYNTSGVYTYNTTNVSGCDSTAVLNLSISKNEMANAAVVNSIGQTLQHNDCGNRVYRFAASPVFGATAYSWVIPSTMGGMPVTVDSGDISFSRVITLRFASNQASTIADSIWVTPYNGCASGSQKGFRMAIGLLSPPLPPSITAKVLNASECGGRRVRYTATGLRPASIVSTVQSYAVGTGYVWTLPAGALGTTCVLDSGSLIGGADGHHIIIRYLSNAQSSGDTVKVAYTSDCGIGNNGNSIVSLAKLNPPTTPTGISASVISNVCGNRVVRYTAPAPRAYVSVGNFAPSAGYAWVLPTGTLGSTCIIDSGNLVTPPGDPNTSARSIRIKYLSNALPSLDTVKVAYISNCGNSPYARLVVSLAAINPPAAPASISIQKIEDLECGKPRYRYSGPASLPLGTSTAAAATGYEWAFVGSRLGIDYTIDSGDINSRAITVQFGTNLAAAANDSIKLRYNSNCGNSVWRASKLTNTLSSTNPPAAPTLITISLVQNSCGARIYRYSVPVLPKATATASAANGYFWTLPTGPVGSTGTLDSGSLSGRVIRIKYTSNAAATSTDSIRVRYTSLCGNGAVRAQKLNNTALSCPSAQQELPITQSKIQEAADFSIESHVYPNPTMGDFNLTVSSSMKSEKVQVRLMNLQGSMLQSWSMMPGETRKVKASMGSGTYLVEMRQGNKRAVSKVIKL